MSELSDDERTELELLRRHARVSASRPPAPVVLPVGVIPVAAVQELADEAKARQAAYPAHPHWEAWHLYESDLRDLIAAHAPSTPEPICVCGYPKSKHTDGDFTAAPVQPPAPDPDETCQWCVCGHDHGDHTQNNTCRLCFGRCPTPEQWRAASPALQTPALLAPTEAPREEPARVCECGNPVGGYHTNTLCKDCHHAAFGGGEDIG